MNRNLTVDIMVGLFVVLGFSALVFLAMRAGNMGAGIGLRFDNIGGLKPRAAVRSAGVVVGRVTSIRFNDKTYQAEVVLALDERYQFPKDSSLKVLTAGLLGEQYLGLEAGGDPAVLEKSGVIKMTQSAVVLENLISQFLYGKAAEGEKK